MFLIFDMKSHSKIVIYILLCFNISNDGIEKKM